MYWEQIFSLFLFQAKFYVVPRKKFGPTFTKAIYRVILFWVGGCPWEKKIGLNLCQAKSGVISFSVGGPKKDFSAQIYVKPKIWCSLLFCVGGWCQEKFSVWIYIKGVVSGHNQCGKQPTNQTYLTHRHYLVEYMNIKCLELTSRDLSLPRNPCIAKQTSVSFVFHFHSCRTAASKSHKPSPLQMYNLAVLLGKQISFAS